MIIGDIDLGPDNPARKPVSGLQIGSFIVYGSRESTTVAGGKALTLDGQTTLSAPFAIGGAAANSAQAALYVAQQLEELAGNPDLQPTYVQFKSGAGVIATTEHDGWYVIEQLDIDRWGAGWKVFFPVTMRLRKINPAGGRRIGFRTDGGAMASAFTGAAIPWVAFPVGAAWLGGGYSKVGADGQVIVITGAGPNPQPTAMGSVANWLKGGCRVFDAMAPIATNPVPTTGAYAHANWVEVKSPDHIFVGDTIITNGFLLLTFSTAGSQNTPEVYLWNTALAVVGWQDIGNVPPEDGAFGGVYTFSVSLLRVGAEEIQWQTLEYGPSSGTNYLRTFRLLRGASFLIIDFQPLSASQSNAFHLMLNSVTTWKVAYNPATTRDVVVESNVSLGQDTVYGYGAAFTANSGKPFITGFLYKSAPGNQLLTTGAANQIAIGDSVLIAKGEVRRYGYFAIPYGVSGSYSTANLQGEAETGSFGAPWVTFVDALASNGGAAKLPSGSAINLSDTIIPASPVAQHSQMTLRAWVRLRVASIASATVQFRIAIFDQTAGSILQSTDFAPSGLSTAYAWYAAGPAIQVPQNHSIYVYVGSMAATTTDLFVDEAVITPLSVAFGGAGMTNSSMPQDLWQQFAYDRTARQVRA